MTLKKSKVLLAAATLVFFSGCLMTRSDVGEAEQSRVYGKKSGANQNSQQESQLSTKAQAVVDERDELVRSLNGRVESLENQLAQVSKEKSQMGQADQQKMQALQEAIVKMEGQINKLESEMAQKIAAAQVVAQQVPQVTKTEDSASDRGSDKNAKNKSSKAKADNTYDLAQGFYANKDWKKAILNYQKYIDDNPKGKDVADSKYKIGVSFQELGMKEEAMAFYEEVVAQFSKSDAAKKAKLRLSKIKK